MSTSAHSPSPPSLSSGSSSSDDSATRSPARPVPSHLPTLLFPASSNASSGTFVLHKSTLPSLSLGDPAQSYFASSDNAQSPRLPPAVDENIFGGVSLEARETAVRSERRTPGAATTRGRRLNGVYTNTPAAGSVSFPDPSTGLPPNGPRRAVGPSANTIADQIEAKVVILGSQGVGKTSIVHRYTSGHFSYSLSSTIGASFLTKKLVVEGCKVRLQIWDTAGQERFRSMAPLYYRGALAAVLIYDITNADSFNDIKTWLSELRRNMSPDLIIHIVGSKMDLASTHRAVDLDLAREMISEWIIEGQEEGRAPPSGKKSHERDPSPPALAAIRDAATTRPRSRTLSTQRGLQGSSTSSSIVGLNSSPFGTTTNGSSTTTISEFPSLTLSSGSQILSVLPTGSEMIRSSSKLSLAANSLVGGLARSRRSTATGTTSLGMGIGLSGMGEELRRAEEEDRKTREAERERGEKLERIERRLRNGRVQVSEVSAKDDYGIEDLFLSITTRLVERKSEIETERVLRSRDSVMLHERKDGAERGGAGANGAVGGWGCC